MKTAHIYIYGIIDDFQEQSEGYVNLNSIRKQLEIQKDFDKIDVHIHSDGGYVSEGFAIYDYLRSQGKPITTKVEGNCYSIATVIALAGDKRIMTSNASFFVHCPWGMAGGDANDIQKYADDLAKEEDNLAEFYKDKTNLSKEKALDLMKKEEFITPKDALDMGFITEIEDTVKAVALYKINSKKNNMSNKNLNERISFLEKIFKKPKAIILQDANGVEIDFYELEDDTTPSIGDKANVDDKSAEGNYIMPDGVTYIFEAGVLIEIKPPTEDEEMADTESELQDLRQEVEKIKARYRHEIKNLKTEIKTLKNNISSKFNYEPELEKRKNSKSRKLFKD